MTTKATPEYWPRDKQRPGVATWLAWHAVALPLALCAAPAHAAEDGLQGFQLHWDNDAFQRSNTDRWYTNGLRASWSWDSKTTSTMARTAKRLAGEWMGGDAPTLTYTVGQSMYTPRDISRADPQPDDRPWGAFLYAGVTAHRYLGDQQFRAIELKVGTTGAAALGRQAQAGVHKYITDSQPPLGWHQQLKARPGLQLSFLQIDRFGDDAEGNDIFGFQTHGGGSVGTLRNYAHVGAAVTVGRLGGKNAPLSVAHEGDFVVQDFNNRSQFRRPFAYLAVGVSGVAYNYFLQGNTPYGRSQIDKKTWVPTGELGLSLPLQHWLDRTWVPRVMLVHTIRGADFKSRAGAQPGPVRHGNLTLYWDCQPAGK
jgi:hypothetical protein